MPTEPDMMKISRTQPKHAAYRALNPPRHAEPDRAQRVYNISTTPTSEAVPASTSTLRRTTDKNHDWRYHDVY
jgi:hypothetical protein